MASLSPSSPEYSDHLLGDFGVQAPHRHFLYWVLLHGHGLFVLSDPPSSLLSWSRIFSTWAVCLKKINPNPLDWPVLGSIFLAQSTTDEHIHCILFLAGVELVALGTLWSPPTASSGSDR